MRRPDPTPFHPSVGAERRRRKFLLFPRTIGNQRVWWEWVWRVSEYTYIPDFDEIRYGWRFARYELID